MSHSVEVKILELVQYKMLKLTSIPSEKKNEFARHSNSGDYRVELLTGPLLSPSMDCNTCIVLQCNLDVKCGKHCGP